MTSPQRKIVVNFIGEENPAFMVQHWPESNPRGHVVYLPPMAEEMNRCRAIVAEQARWFASRGLTVSILDFYGTGESPGDLTDANLKKWHANIDHLIASLLKSTDAPIVLWGCRLGGLIALDYLSQHPGVADKVLLWQPVTSGKAYVTQMLRQRSAGLMERKVQAETTKEMRTRLAAGDNLDVAGYALGGDLTAALDAIDFETFNRIEANTIFWLEHSGDGEHTMGERSRRAVDRLKALATNVEVRYFSGHPLWQLHKRDLCEDLVEQTRLLDI